MLRPALGIIGLSLLLSLSGCATWFSGGDEDPQVKLLKVEPVKVKLVQQQLNLRLRIDNPNDASVLVRAIQYKVRLNEVLLVDDEYSGWFVVEGHSHKNVTVPVRTNLWAHLKDIAKMLRKPDQSVHYRLEGKLKTGFLFGRHVRIERDGEIIPGVFIPE